MICFWLQRQRIKTDKLGSVAHHRTVYKFGAYMNNDLSENVLINLIHFTMNHIKYGNNIYRCRFQELI